MAPPNGFKTRPEVSVFWGFLAGFAYTLLDGYLDQTFGVPRSPPARPIEVLHAIIDFVLPPITGGLFGVAVHYVRLRARMAALEKQRADDLTGDLHKVERDQAVWVISASLLHELKNPLHALGLLLDEALETSDGERETQRQLLVRARAQVERIARELATLRSLPGTARPELPVIDIEEALRRIVQVYTDKLPWLSLALDSSVQGAAQCQVNAGYLRIILENLLENSAEALSDAYHENPTIRVELREEAQRYAISVCDNGPGVDSETKEQLFEPWNTSKPAGMGLGLAITRALARSMGGDVELLELPPWTCFKLTLVRGSGVA